MLLGADWRAVRSALLLGGSRLAEADFGEEGAARMRAGAAALAGGRGLRRGKRPEPCGDGALVLAPVSAPGNA